MAIFYELQNSDAGRALDKVGFEPDPDNRDVYIKVFGESLLAIQVDRPGMLHGPRKLSDPILLDIFDRTEPTPSMRLKFPSLKAFLESVYDHR